MLEIAKKYAALIITGFFLVIISLIVVYGAVLIHKHTACEMNGGWYSASTDSCGTLQENE